MKPNPLSTIQHRLARHDRRAQGRRTWPASDYFFQPETDGTIGRVRRRGDGRARRAFRRMSAEMMASQNDREPLEMIVFGFVAAIAAWPLVSVLIVLAQTANR